MESGASCTRRLTTAESPSTYPKARDNVGRRMTIQWKRIPRGWWRIPLLIVLLLVMPCAGFGQEPSRSFEQLRGLVMAGDRVTVIDATGGAARGTVIRITDDELAVAVDGSARNWTPSGVRQIRRRTGDSVLNGTLIGGAIGVGIGSLSYLDNECREEAGCAAGLVFGAAICAGIGAAIDALIRADRIIYQGPAGSDTSRIHMMLVGGKGRAALQFKVRF
jgi:hypothetical protein